MYSTFSAWPVATIMKDILFINYAAADDDDDDSDALLTCRAQ